MSKLTLDIIPTHLTIINLIVVQMANHLTIQ